MVHWVIWLASALLCVPASALDSPHGLGPPAATAEPDAEGGLFGPGKGPASTVEDEIKEKTEEQKALERRLEEVDKALRDKPARVIVLQWKDSDTDYTNEALKRNIKARIARPDAQFFPEIDLYQEGRTEPDPTVRPADQRATVPKSSIPRVMNEVEAVAAIPFDAISEQEWGIRANELRALSDEIWFVDDVELREPLFLLYAQIGRAAENSNQGAPPFFENIDGQPVNYYYYLAATLAYQDPTLLSKLTTQDLYVPISNYRDMLDSGQFRQQTLGFGDEDRNFDPKAFNSDFEVYINGELRNVANINGLVEVPLGRVDVYLKRLPAGHGLSATEERTTIPENVALLLQIARLRMGIDFIEQLMVNPSECTPLLSGYIVNYLSVYAKLHNDSDIYIAVPQYGSTSPGKIYLWRWDRARAQLFLVLDNTGGFPVRFAALLGAGVSFGSVDLAPPEVTTANGEPPTADNADVANQLDGLAPQIDLGPEGAPIFYQLRGHYNRVFMGVGLQYKVSLMGRDFADRYQTQTHRNRYAVETTRSRDHCTDFAPCEPVVTSTEVLRERSLQRLVYGMLGFMLGKDAGVGFGPRGYLRTGWYNMPHAVDLTVHLGVTAKPPGANKKDEDRMGRVRGLLDLDFYGGALLPVQDSVFVKEHGLLVVGKPMINFGLTVGAGLTF